MKTLLLCASLLTCICLSSSAQDQTVNGHLYIGQGSHDQIGYGKLISFIGNTDPCFITQFNTAPNQTEFRFNMGDDFESFDKFAIGVTWAVDGQWYPKMVVQGDGKVGIGTSNPQYKLDVADGDIRSSGSLIVSSGNATGGGIRLADDGDIVDLNDGWATHRFSYGLRLTNGNASGSPVIQLANGVEGQHSYFNAGFVGIGTSTPTNRLRVNGGAVVLGYNSPSTNTDGHFSLGDTQASSLPTAGNWVDQTTLLLNARDFSTIGFHDSEARVDFIRAGGGTIDIGYNGGWGEANVGLPGGLWDHNGNVGIGTRAPDARLTVNGTLHSREVKVDVNIPPPDYVFAPQYHLLPLQEVDQYIKANRHLPQIPTAAEMEKEGINLSEMNLKLLSKVEELTLYLINKEQQLERQDHINRRQQRQIDALVRKAQLRGKKDGHHKF